MSVLAPKEQLGAGYFWHGQALLLCLVDDNATHRHHALQITISLSGGFRLQLPSNDFDGRALIITPDHPHRLVVKEGLQAVFLLEPESTVARSLVAAYLLRGKTAALDEHLVEPFVEQLVSLSRQPPSCAEALRICDDLLATLLGESRQLPIDDPRICEALASLRQLPENKGSVQDIARSVGISESRLMHLFKEQVGIPIRRYLLWRRLMVAIDSVRAGQSLTTAAHGAGFADSAHLSRTFRQMFGMTPVSCFKNSRFLQVVSCPQ